MLLFYIGVGSSSILDVETEGYLDHQHFCERWKMMIIFYKVIC